MSKDSVKGLSFFHYVAPLDFYQMMALVLYQIEDSILFHYMDENANAAHTQYKTIILPSFS